MTGILDQLLAVGGPILYVGVGLLVFAEDALFVGFLLPGETAAVLGGVAASRGRVSLIVMCVVVVTAAIVGDSVGYGAGARFGTRLISCRGLHRRAVRIDAARAGLARRGGPAVFGGRFVAFLRPVIPFLAGSSRMPYRRFLAFNGAGGLVWGAGSVLLGYLAGDSYAVAEKAFGRAAALVAAVLIVTTLVVWRIRRRGRRRLRRRPGVQLAGMRAAHGAGNAEGMLRCVIVDDSTFFLEVARALLEREGITVVGVASNGTQALSTVADLRPDVALVDIDLGSESGLELTRQLARQAGEALPIILTSAHDEEDYADLIAASPVVGFLPKTSLSARAIRDLLDGVSGPPGT